MNISYIGKQLALFLIVGLVIVAVSGEVFALGTPAGIVITNGGDGGTGGIVDVPGDTIVTRDMPVGVMSFPSNIVTVTVSTGYAISFTAGTTSQILTTGSTVFYSCVITNFGNVPDEFAISVSTVAGEPWQTKIIKDENSDRIHQPDETNEVNQSGILSPGASFYLFVSAVVLQPKSGNLFSASVLTVKDRSGLGIEDYWPDTTYNDIIYSTFTTYLTAVSFGIKIIDGTGKDVELNNGIVKIFIEPNDMGRDVFLFYSTNPLSAPLLVSKSKIYEANYKDDENPRINRLPDSIIEFALQDDSGAWFINKEFNSEVELRISYKDADNNGYVDDVNPPVYEKSIKIYVLNETKETWEEVRGSSADTLNNYVSAKIKHFSVYLLMGTPAPSDLSGIRVFPNPYKPGSGGAFDRPGGVVFDNVTENITIKIFNIAAELVFEDSSANTGGQYEWKAVNNSGQNVASGVYIYFVTNEKSQKKSGKFVIIR